MTDFRFSKNPTREKNRALVGYHKELFLVGNATRLQFVLRVGFDNISDIGVSPKKPVRRRVREPSDREFNEGEQEASLELSSDRRARPVLSLALALALSF